MASSNIANQQDASAAALVPFEPIFSPSPVSFVMPQEQLAAANSSSSSSSRRRRRRRRKEIPDFVQQPEAVELETEHKKRPKQRTKLNQIIQFDFVLPRDYVPVMDDEITKLVSLGHENWLPLAERLTGWIKEVRVRTSGIRDTFYYHRQKKYRTFKDVKRYIYLGYPPYAENADEPLERLALSQPDPRRARERPLASFSCGRPD